MTDLPELSKVIVHGLPVTTIDVSGEYSGVAGPSAAAPVPVSGYRLLGAIVEGPGGNVFIKFTGPAKTMAANQAKFQQLIDSFEKAGKWHLSLPWPRQSTFRTAVTPHRFAETSSS